MGNQPGSNILHVLVACFPKSASSYLSETIAYLPGMRREFMVPAFGQREQELCLHRILEADKSTYAIRKFMREKEITDFESPRGYVAQHHVRKSDATAAIIKRKNIGTIVLTRNIYDCIVSLRDHICTHPLLPMAHVPSHFNDMPEAQQHLFIASMIVPWYFNFYTSWVNSDDAMWVTYEELTDDPEATFDRVRTTLLEEYSIEDMMTAAESAMKADVRFNKGVSGRGAEVSGEVRAIVEGYTEFYPSVDFGRMGL